MNTSRLGAWAGLSALVATLIGVTAGSLQAQGPQLPATVKGQPIKSLLSHGGYRALQLIREARPSLRAALPGIGEEDEDDGQPTLPADGILREEPDADEAPLSSATGPGSGNAGGGLRNVFVNDPCLDPPPPGFPRTVQSETEIAVLNEVPDDGDNGKSGSGRLMVAGFNDSYGFYDNRQGLSGFSYSTNGGKLWIDASGLPPLGPTDQYFGDPVVVVHHRSKTFYYASIYGLSDGTSSLAVNRGQFRVAPQQVPFESKANTRCEGNPAAFGIPDPPPAIQERIIWEPPVVAVPITGGTADDFIDKEWLYVDQRTGFLYLAYVRFGADGGTPLELVHSLDGGHTWIGPSVIVPNLNDTFNTGVSVVTTLTGRVIVSWFARTFPAPAFVEREQRIETAFSDNCTTAAPCTFSMPALVSTVNPQGEPPGYNRGRTTILNVTYLAADKGKYDGAGKKNGNEKNDEGNVYITYFSGKTPLAQAPNPATTVFARAADIFLSRSTNNATTWQPRIKVNDDNTVTSHVFPSVQVNESGIVFDTWLDRRVDPRNLLTDTWGAISKDDGQSFRGNFRITNVSTDWIVRADARPNFGDYNSSEVINFKDFVSIWSDGRFPPPVPLTPTATGFTRPAAGAATPDVLFSDIGSGLSHGGGGGDR